MKNIIFFLFLNLLLSAFPTAPIMNNPAASRRSINSKHFFSSQQAAGNKTHNVGLKGKKIVITAPEIYALRLQKALEKYGAQITLMPTIETIVYDSLPQLSQLNDSIRPQCPADKKFDFVVLPSRNAIKAFDLEIKREGNKEDWLEAPFYVLGKDQEYLQSLGYKSTIIVKEPSMKGILSFIKENKAYDQKEMLLIAPKISMIKEPNVVPDFITEAKRMGIRCHLIYGYTTRPVINKQNEAVIMDLQKGKYDIIALTSGGESYALAEQLQEKEIVCKIACFGPYTASNAEIAGFSVDMISDKFSSFDDYATSIVNYFNP